MEGPQKTKYSTTKWPSNPTLGHLSGQNYPWKRHMHLYVLIKQYGVFICLGHCNKNAFNGVANKQQTFVSLSSGSWRVQDQGTKTIWCLVRGCFLTDSAVSLHGGRGTGSLWRSLFSKVVLCKTASSPGPCICASFKFLNLVERLANFSSKGHRYFLFGRPYATTQLWLCHSKAIVDTL